MGSNLLAPKTNPNQHARLEAEIGIVKVFMRNPYYALQGYLRKVLYKLFGRKLMSIGTGYL